MNQLHLLVIDEITLVNTRTLTFIDHKLWVIKQVHNQFMGGIDVIMIGDFYQMPPKFMDFYIKNY
jgi:hypothetical protein